MEKILANRLKPILSAHISPEQFAFLQNRQIHEAIGTAQELLHSMQSKKLKGMILKVDLSKAFNKASLLYIRMILTHLGFPYMFIKWIMSCISDVAYNILLNGSPTPFFTAKRGLRQGCPLSPLLFLLIMEGLSRLIGAEHRRGRITGIKITKIFSLTHLLFVDNVLIFLSGGLADTCALHNVFDLFQKAIGMTINVQKSTLTAIGCSQYEVHYTLHWFPFPIHTMEEGLKYLGFRLKPGGYKIANWIWLIVKVEKRLNVWYNKYLTWEGRLTLIKAVLEATPVYWMSLAWIPRGILARLQKICCRFLWKGNKQGNLFAWIKWETIARPKKWGGWGIKRLDFFAKALAGVTHITNIADPENSSFFQQAWKTAQELYIPGHWRQDWEDFTEALTQAHIRITQEEDEVVWAFEKNGKYSPKEGYLKLIQHLQPETIQQWWKALWKLKAASRTRILMWNILFNKIPTGSNLMRQSFHGPFWCHLCKENDEDTEHLFLTCPIVTEQWTLIISSLPSLQQWQGHSIIGA
eukprot:PITA_25808